MKYVINDHVVLSRPPDGPLATQLGAFAASRTALGYARSSIRREIRLAAGFSHWLTHEHIALRRIDAGHVARYLRHRRRRMRPGPGDDAALRHLLECLRREGVIAAAPIATRRLTAVERGVQAYIQYLRDARALASATITNYAPFIQQFLTDQFKEGPVRLPPSDGP
jgi:site-specific recombinase XerD